MFAFLMWVKNRCLSTNLKKNLLKALQIKKKRSSTLWNINDEMAMVTCFLE